VRGPTGESQLQYDALILAQGSRPIVPAIPGIPGPNVFTLWTLADMDRLDQFLETARPKTAAIVGGGFIGLETAEALVKRGTSVSLVELQQTIMPQLDPEIGRLISKCLQAFGVRVVTGAAISAVRGMEVELSDRSRLPADCVLLAIGARPNLELATAAGLEVGASGGIVVDEHMQTSDPSIWAAGDMVEVVHRVTGRTVRVPLAGPANRQGRIAASNALGLPMKYSGALGSSVVKVFDSAVAFTGLTEAAARGKGFDVEVHVNDMLGWFSAKTYAETAAWSKIIVDKPTDRILGAHFVGHEGQELINVFGLAIKFGITARQLRDNIYAYPTFSSDIKHMFGHA